MQIDGPIFLIIFHSQVMNKVLVMQPHQGENFLFDAGNLQMHQQ
jgi:hypothetical protein